MDFPSRYPQVIISSYFYLPLFLYLSLNICSSFWWRNLIRAERETGRNKSHSERRKQGNNVWSVTPRADKIKISVFNSDLVDLKEGGILNPVTTLDETVYRRSSAQGCNNASLTSGITNKPCSSLAGSYELNNLCADAYCTITCLTVSHSVCLHSSGRWP